ncbi:MAG: pantetheine-phosphate adenylyltransferase [Dehalococcoidia bacterium]|nr:pantetheine-phosphate adenylyltransferase [Dehalococcoidia bacterium]MCB9486837.1 pantetheine-phosphate adenylyltransferase [Thermoflexaceae bacterium]
MRIAVYPGGFDPVTNGHLDLVTRTARLFDKVIVAVVKGRGKDPMFDWEERIELFKTAVADMPSVEVQGFSGLTVDYARAQGAIALVRGIRAVSDFEAEFSMALMNRRMAPEIESVYLMTNKDFLYVSASRIREVSRLGYDVAGLVPANVRTAIRQKLGLD